MKKILLIIFLVITLNAETLIEYKKSVEAEVKNFYTTLYEYIPDDRFKTIQLIFAIQLNHSKTIGEIDIITLDFLFKRHDILMQISKAQQKIEDRKNREVKNEKDG